MKIILAGGHLEADFIINEFKKAITNLSSLIQI